MAVKKVFVGGVKDGIEQNDLQEYFQQYGNVVSVDLVIDRETGRKRGFGFVSFDDFDSVDKIVCKCFVSGICLLYVVSIACHAHPCTKAHAETSIYHICLSEILNCMMFHIV